MNRLLAAEAIFEKMEELGLNDEEKEFEDMLRLCTDIAVEGWDWNEDVLQAGTEIAGDGNWALTFMTWKFWTDKAADSLTGLLMDLVAEGRMAIENRVSAGTAARAGAGTADTAESACDADLSCNWAESGGCAEAEAPAAETELLGHRTEDQETAANWLAGAAAVRLAQECGPGMGVSGEEPGAASDEAGRVEGRKKSFGSLPPMSEHRTSLYAKSVCG